MQFYACKIRHVLNVQYVLYCAVLCSAPLGSVVFCRALLYTPYKWIHSMHNKLHTLTRNVWRFFMRLRCAHSFSLKTKWNGIKFDVYRVCLEAGVVERSPNYNTHAMHSGLRHFSERARGGEFTEVEMGDHKVQWSNTCSSKGFFFQNWRKKWKTWT